MSPLQRKGQLDPAAQKQGEDRCDGHQAAHTGDVLVGDLPRCVTDILFFAGLVRPMTSSAWRPGSSGIVVVS